MRYKITERGVYDQSGAIVPVGTVITASSPAPAWLTNKAEALPEPEKAVAVTNPKRG